MSRIIGIVPLVSLHCFAQDHCAARDGRILRTRANHTILPPPSTHNNRTLSLSLFLTLAWHMHWYALMLAKLFCRNATASKPSMTRCGHGPRVDQTKQGRRRRAEAISQQTHFACQKFGEPTVCVCVCVPVSYANGGGLCAFARKGSKQFLFALESLVPPKEKGVW